MMRIKVKTHTCFALGLIVVGIDNAITGKTIIAQTNKHEATYNLKQAIASFNLQTQGNV